MSSKIVNGFLVMVTICGLLGLAVLCTTEGIKFDGEMLLLALAIICIPAYLSTLPIKQTENNT
ncbi:MAG: hypothetical protein WC813_03980 [Patescibacteria group bacterium]|jgi:hypothetical protein